MPKGIGYPKKDQSRLGGKQDKRKGLPRTKTNKPKPMSQMDAALDKFRTLDAVMTDIKSGKNTVVRKSPRTQAASFRGEDKSSHRTGGFKL